MNNENSKIRIDDEKLNNAPFTRMYWQLESSKKNVRKLEKRLKRLKKDLEEISEIYNSIVVIEDQTGEE